MLSEAMRQPKRSDVSSMILRTCADFGKWWREEVHRHVDTRQRTTQWLDNPIESPLLGDAVPRHRLAR